MSAWPQHSWGVVPCTRCDERGSAGCGSPAGKGWCWGGLAGALMRSQALIPCRAPVRGSRSGPSRCRCASRRTGPAGLAGGPPHSCRPPTARRVKARARVRVWKGQGQGQSQSQGQGQGRRQCQCQCQGQESGPVSGRGRMGKVGRRTFSGGTYRLSITPSWLSRATTKARGPSGSSVSS
eukprot:scaffold3970_cov57-Phaeocystis_antarctica.AAC.3